jgi:hypothetical protein
LKDFRNAGSFQKDVERGRGSAENACGIETRSQRPETRGIPMYLNK